MYSESDTRSKFIDPKLKASNWSESHIVREHYFTDGRKGLGGKRGRRKFADYILTHKWIKLAIIEAKKYELEITEGLEQVKEYGKCLNLRFVYSCNGKGIYEFDLQEWKGEKLESFPSPEKLYDKVFWEIDTVKQALLSEPFLLSDKKPRYYQEIAIQKGVEAIAEDKKRILLTLATGTGKTVIAFQMVYKLFQARWSLDGIGVRRPRILFLADRNVLVDQAMNTFNPMEKDILKINGVEIKKRGGKVPKNSNIFFTIYQALAWGAQWDDGEGEIVEEAYYNRYEKDFFDLIIIDECHRWGAKEQWNWAEILKYFESAVQIGLTATPKRDDNVDTYKYFGAPIYEYSLKAGIDDGFLTPFKIKRIKLNIDELVLNSWDEIVSGNSKKDVYYAPDMERTIIIEERSDLIAQTILQQIGKMEKTIIFCVDQWHALRIRDSINKYKSVKDPDYCVRVTSNEWEIGRRYLERFQDNDKDIPVILTSSQMLTTWVDALNVRNIVLVRNIGSIVEYKQIVWRGTRVFEGKDFFTIYDFMGATNDFSDEIWDGAPEDIEIIDGWDEKPQDTSPPTPLLPGEGSETSPESEPKEKLIVKLGPTREVKVIDIETRYLDPVTWKHLSSEAFLERIVGELPKLYSDEHQLRMLWANPDTRQELLENLAKLGIEKDQLDDLKRMFHAENSDIFDILAHLSFDSDIKYRQERSEYAKGIIEHYESLKAQEFLDFLLALYVKQGILDFRKDRLSRKIELYGKWQAREIAQEFWGMEKLVEAYYEVQRSLYSK